ncbi:MAG: helix-turn-helix domain-containing protein [Acutalibacteraceae bacterium]
MEKRTMGALMSALRKSKGMTQQDVADRLGVSNKAVSKWECDDGYPDISILPAIAELYGVTVDELLRGEIRNEEKTVSPEKGIKQIEFMLRNAQFRFKNLSVIALVLSVLSPIFALIVPNTIYSITINSNLIALIGAVLISAAAIVIEIYASNRLMFSLTGEEAQKCGESLNACYLTMKKYLCCVIVFSVLGIALGAGICLSWEYALPEISTTAICVVIALLAAAAVYTLVSPKLTGNITDEKTKERNKYNQKTVRNAFIGIVCISLILSVAVSVTIKITDTHKIKFENEEQMTAFQQYFEEGKYPVFEKDDKALTVTVLSDFHGVSVDTEYVDSPYDAESIGETEITFDDGSTEVVETMTYRFKTAEEMNSFLSEYCVDGSFKKYLPYLSPTCTITYDFERLTVKYTTPYYIEDVIELIVLCDLSVCLVFVLIYIVVRSRKFKKER